MHVTVVCQTNNVVHGSNERQHMCRVTTADTDEKVEPLQPPCSWQQHQSQVCNCVDLDIHCQVGCIHLMCSVLKQLNVTSAASMLGS